MVGDALVDDAPHVLLVDDERAILDGLAPFLERSGLRVSTAGDGQQALDVHAATPADILVCDVLMPRLDGRSLVRRLRAGGDWTPVVLLTQVGESYERSAALEEGADDYLNKPFDPQELLARVRAVLRRAYIDSVVGNLKGHLDVTYFVDEKGNKEKLKKKGE